MMDILSISLGLVGLILGAATVLKSFSVVKEREAAEKELVKILVHSYKKSQDGKVPFSVAAPSADELRKLEIALEQSIKELNESYRVSVVRAIQQPSAAGRSAYRQKLIKEISEAAI